MKSKREPSVFRKYADELGYWVNKRPGTVFTAGGLIGLVVYILFTLREWVGGDVQGRLILATIIFMVAVVISLVALVIWLSKNDRPQR